MDDAAIYAKLTTIFQDTFDDDDLVPHGEMTASHVEEWDSLAQIRLVVAIEMEFDMKFAVTELGTLQTVGDMVALIRNQLP